MAHEVLHLERSELADREAPEGVPEIVEAERSKLGASLGIAVAAAKGGAVEVAPRLAGEDEIVRAGEVFA